MLHPPPAHAHSQATRRTRRPAYNSRHVPRMHLHIQHSERNKEWLACGTHIATSWGPWSYRQKGCAARAHERKVGDNRKRTDPCAVLQETAAGLSTRNIQLVCGGVGLLPINDAHAMQASYRAKDLAVGADARRTGAVALGPHDTGVREGQVRRLVVTAVDGPRERCVRCWA